MSLSPGNRVHPYEDSRRCELTFTNGRTAGQAVSEDGSPCGQLAVSPADARVPEGEGSVGRDSSSLCPQCCLQTACSLGFAKWWKTNQVLL